MLDALFVRDNLAFVQARLESRGLDPAAELARFVALDAARSARWLKTRPGPGYMPP